jgi:ribonuclease R
VNPKGFGFLEVEGDTDDLYVRESNMGNALDGDLVLAGLSAPTRGDRRREAEVLEVVERRRNKVVGTFRKKGHFAFVVPDDNRVTQDVYVPENVVQQSEATATRLSSRSMRSKIAVPLLKDASCEVIGPSSDSGVQVLSLAMSYDVRAGFPDEVVQEAESIDRYPSDAPRSNEVSICGTIPSSPSTLPMPRTSTMPSTSANWTMAISKSVFTSPT